MTKIGAMMLLPAKQGTCPACAVKHTPDEPHDATSLFYQYHFYGLHGRWPTWADAIAHCTSHVQRLWKEALEARGKWSEPVDGEPSHDDAR